MPAAFSDCRSAFAHRLRTGGTVTTNAPFAREETCQRLPCTCHQSAANQHIIGARGRRNWNANHD